MAPREPENWSPAATWLDGRYRNSGQWIDGDTGKRFTPKQDLPGVVTVLSGLRIANALRVTDHLTDRLGTPLAAASARA